MIRKIGFTGFFMALTTFVGAQFAYQSYNYTIDFAQEGKPHEIYWNSTGFTPGDWLFRKDMQLTLDYLAAVPNQETTYIRPHWLLNLIGSRGIGTDNPEYNFERLDAALDEMVNRGFKLIFEIMGFPSLEWEVGENIYDDDAQEQKNQAQQWDPDFENEQDYLEWYDFVKALITHLDQRYGTDEIKSWYFECTNEPDIHRWFWDRGIPALLNYWDATSEAIKAVNPEFQFGGPGTARGLSDEFKAVLAHCDTGTNAITGEKGAVLDFISVHRKELIYNMIDNEIELVQYIRDHHPRFKDLPFWNNEADPMAGWSRHYWWRPHPWYGAFIVQSVDAHNRLLIDSLGVNYGILLNDNGFLGNWYQRTALARYNNSENEDHLWLFKKPALSAMTMLALTKGTRFDVEGYASTREHVIVIPAKSKTGEIVLLLVNKPEFGPPHNNWVNNEYITLEQKELHDPNGASVKLSLKNMGIENPELMKVQLDAMHGYAHGAWKRLGKPDTITTEIYRAIATNMDPVVVEEGLSLEGAGKETLHVVLPPSSVTMLIIRDKDKDIDFPQPEITGITEYTGYNGEKKNFISWQQAEGAIVRYTIYASYDGAEYQKVNPYPVFERGYLDVLPETVQTAVYRIKVVK